MNPFTLPGPEFLAFYFWLALAVLVVCVVRMRMGGEGRDMRLDRLTEDPYRIAFLRGGRDELIRVAVFNLVDRGILEYQHGLLVAARPEARDFLRRNVDRALLAHFHNGGTFDGARSAPAILAVAAEYERELRKEGLLLDEREKTARSWFVLYAILLLVAVAGIKIAYALFAGRTNVLYLALMAVGAVVLVLVVYADRLTRAGKRAVRNAQTLLGRLKRNISRVSAGGASNEALLLAAAFGLHVLPAEAFPFVDSIQPRPKSSSDVEGADGDGGSSCGSGGGGCGGGCGGCGSD